MHTTAPRSLQDGHSVWLALAEESGSVHLLAHSAKGDRDAFGAQGAAAGGGRLQARAAVQLGAPACAMMRVALRRPAEDAAAPAGGVGAVAALGAGAAVPAAQRLGVLLALRDGSLSLLCPLAPAAFRRLALLQEKLVRALPHAGALHPRAFRAHRTGARSAGVLAAALDGGLLGAYLALPVGAQERLAAQVGTRRSAVLDDLDEVAAAALLLF